MADTVDITAGVGTTIATDDCAGVHYQQVKLVDGTADSTTVIAVDVGAKANAVRVAPANDITDATYIGDIKFGEAEPNSGDIKTAVESIDGNITACNTGAVVVASGSITEDNSANIQAAVEIMDDWDATHDSAASADGVQLMGAYDSTKPAAVADGDAVRVLTDAYGRLLAGVEPTAWSAVYDSADASGEGEVVKASAASTIVVLQSYIISSDAELWVKLQDEDSTALTGKFWLKAGGGVAITLPDKAPIVLGVDKDLEVISEGAGNVSVSATGYTIPG
jgi:hypothetical protein